MENEGKYNSVTVAKLIVAYANRHGFPINMTKVQKLLYIAYGVYLAVNGSRLTDEHPQAWPYGPVFPTTRNKLLKTDMYAIKYGDKELDGISADGDIGMLLDSVFRTFGSWSASRLTEWSHGDGSPWENTVAQEGFVWGWQIPDDRIKSYFENIVVGK